MTVADNTSRNQYTATAAQTVFAYTFEIVDKDDIVVLKNGTTLSEGTNYTVSNVGNDSGGNVTLTAGATAGDILTLYRDMPYARTQNYTNSGDFLASEVNSDFDNLWLAGEQTNRAFSQSIRKPITDSDSISMELPEAANRAGKYLQFDSTGAVGVTPGGASSSLSRQQFTGNGSTTAFTLSAAPDASGNGLQIYIDGVYQESTTYSVSGSTLTFTEAPPLNSGIEVVKLQAEELGSTTANLITYTPAGTGAVDTTVQAKLREGVSVFDYLSDAQRADVLAYSFGVDVTASCQAALDAAHAANKNCYFPAGGYLVTGLTIPGNVDGSGTDDRNKGMRIYGQGFGEPFVHLNTGGTVIKSVTDAPVLKDILGTANSSNGTIRVDNIRFDGTSTNHPVVNLTSFYGISTFHNCVVYQRGTGDGLRLGWGATVWVHECYVMNKDWASYTVGASRVGTGISYVPTADNGLVTISKCTSRGWLTGYQLAGAAGTAYSACIDKCEASVTYNGVILQSNTRKCVVSNSYFEGGDGGVGINNLGNYNSIKDNLFFAGYATVIQDLGTSNIGTLIEGNLIAIGNTVNGKGIALQSSAAFGGYDKSITNNSINYTAGTAGVKGIQIAGTSPRLQMIGNSFDPRGAWTGSGSIKIDDQTTGEGPFGLITQENGDYEFPVLSSGALSLFRSSSALTQSDVSSNTLTIPNGSYFTVTATAATTVNKFSAGTLEGRVVVFRTTNANMTFADTAYNQLAGGASFTGPGTITFFIDKVGSDNYAYELSRSVF